MIQKTFSCGFFLPQIDLISQRYSSLSGGTRLNSTWYILISPFLKLRLSPHFTVVCSACLPLVKIPKFDVLFPLAALWIRGHRGHQHFHNQRMIQMIRQTSEKSWGCHGWWLPTSIWSHGFPWSERQQVNFFLYIPRVNRLLLANFKCQTYDTSRRRALKWNKSIQVHHPPAMKCLAKIRVIYIYVYIYNIYILYIMFFSWVLTLLGPYLALALWCNFDKFWQNL